MTPPLPLLAAASPDAGGLYLATSILPAVVLLGALPLALLAAARWNARIPVTQDAARRLPMRCFLVGLFAALAVLLLLAASGASAVFGFPALLAGVAALCLGFLGLAAEARSIGAELRGRDPAPGEVAGGSVAVGWLVLAGIPLVPVAGPLVLLYLGIRGTGASSIALTTGTSPK